MEFYDVLVKLKSRMIYFMCLISSSHGCSLTCQMSVIVQEVLRVFIIRIACLNNDYASQLVKPIVSWISNRLSEQSVLSDAEAYKVISKNSFNVVPFWFCALNLFSVD